MFIELSQIEEEQLVKTLVLCTTLALLKNPVVEGKLNFDVLADVLKKLRPAESD